MRVHYIVTSGQRALGAMFSKDLDDEILVFFYPHSCHAHLPHLLLPADQDHCAG